MKNYISLNRADELINFGFDKNFQPKKKDGVFIEMTGYDLVKYFNLACKTVVFPVPAPATI